MEAPRRLKPLHSVSANRSGEPLRHPKTHHYRALFEKWYSSAWLGLDQAPRRLKPADSLGGYSQR